MRPPIRANFWLCIIASIALVTSVMSSPIRAPQSPNARVPSHFLSRNFSLVSCRSGPVLTAAMPDREPVDADSCDFEEDAEDESFWAFSHLACLTCLPSVSPSNLLSTARPGTSPPGPPPSRFVVEAPPRPSRRYRVGWRPPLRPPTSDAIPPRGLVRPFPGERPRPSQPFCATPTPGPGCSSSAWAHRAVACLIQGVGHRPFFVDGPGGHCVAQVRSRRIRTATALQTEEFRDHESVCVR